MPALRIAALRTKEWTLGRLKRATLVAELLARSVGKRVNLCARCRASCDVGGCCADGEPARMVDYRVPAVLCETNCGSLTGYEQQITVDSVKDAANLADLLRRGLPLPPYRSECWDAVMRLEDEGP